jgi:hypothetical protein
MVDRLAVGHLTRIDRATLDALYHVWDVPGGGAAGRPAAHVALSRKADPKGTQD